MKKIAITFVILITISTTGYFAYQHYNTSFSPLKKAERAERSGQLQTAYDLYSEALIDICPSFKVPDINKSKVVEVTVWKKDLAKYVEWLCLPAPVPEHYSQVLQTINKYKDTYSRSESRIVNIAEKALDTSRFISEWKNAFFAPAAKTDSAHLQLASGAHFRNFSFLKLSADKGFTYELNLINLSSGKQTTFKIFSEGSTSVLAYPGRYLLLCRSTVAFSSGEIWRSSITIMPITIPKEASLITGVLITKVARGK
jgi:hypothetical protein